MAVKTSILVFYLILTQGEKFFRRANYATLVVTNLAGLALTLVYIFQCNPVGAAFLSTIPPGAECIDIVTLYLSSPVNIITDLAILFLPMPILTKMRLPRRQKTILVITFGFGFFAIVVDVVRIAFLQQAASSRRFPVDAIHISDNSSFGFNCMTFSIASYTFSGWASLTFLNSYRVCLAVFHVVRRRSQRIDNLWLCSDH